jgi:hypothetical protein
LSGNSVSSCSVRTIPANVSSLIGGGEHCGERGPPHISDESNCGPCVY